MSPIGTPANSDVRREGGTYLEATSPATLHQSNRVRAPILAAQHDNRDAMATMMRFHDFAESI